jgi:RsiW-degrading membrane proteinase PrsW (M82 family)
VNPQAWVRSIIVAGTSLLTFRFVVLAGQDRPRALLRLRIVVSILFVAIVAVLFFVPLPLWMVIEQCVCGLLLAGTAVVIFRRDAIRGR